MVGFSLGLFTEWATDVNVAKQIVPQANQSFQIRITSKHWGCGKTDTSASGVQWLAGHMEQAEV